MWNDYNIFIVNSTKIHVKNGITHNPGRGLEKVFYNDIILKVVLQIL